LERLKALWAEGLEFDRIAALSTTAPKTAIAAFRVPAKKTNNVPSPAAVNDAKKRVLCGSLTMANPASGAPTAKPALEAVCEG
jgi:hypothetical protein